MFYPKTRSTLVHTVHPSPSSPDCYGDGQPLLRLVLVLASAAPHQHVAVLQLLRSLLRHTRAAVAAAENGDA